MMGTNSLVGDPKLTKTGTIAPGNLTADYFKLTSTSPAIDKGIALPEVIEDYFKTSRPQGGGYDIGAHEYNN